MAPPLSVVVPVRNEESTLGDLHRRLRQALPAGSEIIFVDDGSTDGSLKVLERLAAADHQTLALRFLRPFGKSQALAAGFARARGEIVATIDADLQESPEEIVRLARLLRTPEAPGLDLVGGWRRQRRDPFLKVAGSRLFNALIRLFSGVPLRDINCGLKVMRREVVEEIRLEGGFHRFIPLLAHWRGFQVGEVEVAHAPRRSGKSRFGKERIAHGLIDFLVLLFLERFERRPSRLFIGSGAVAFLAGLVISALIAYWRLAYGSIGGHYPLLALGVLLLIVGVQLISMGLLAELVAHRRHGRGRPAAEPRIFVVEPRGEGEGAAVPPPQSQDAAHGTRS
ncbi:MAG: glycosyltransferase family 2 protein [Planctomycetes bacterium]|nr:glycosyltransferase family 2 protein [Planctomycetota bacterium]